MSDNQINFQQAQTYVAKFEKEMDPNLLQDAHQALEYVDVEIEKELPVRNQLRINSLQLWLHMLNLLDQYVDLNFDINDTPEKLIQPPPTSDGVVHRPGASPERISDPELRAQYEKAIASNDAKIKYYTMQVKLHRMNERITSLAEEFIKTHYSYSIENKDEAKRLIVQLIKSDERISRLLTVLDQT